MRAGSTIHRRSPGMGQTPVAWTVEDKERLLAAWMEQREDGGWMYSASALESLFPGRTKNSLIGVLQRMGAPQRGTPIGNGGAGGARSKPAQSAHHKPLKAARPHLHASRRPPKPPVIRLPVPAYRPVSTYFSAGEACQYILNDERPYVFCGSPRSSDGPYCAHHHRVCYVPARS